MTDPRRQSSPNRARSSSNAARSRLLWTMRLWTFIWRRHLRKKHNKESVITCTVTKDVDTSRLKYYTCPHSFTQLQSKAYIPQRCGRDYIKETGIFFQHSAARRANGATPEGKSLLWRHDNTSNALYSFKQRQISRWRRRWYMQTGEGGRFLPTSPSFFQYVMFMLSSCTRIRLHFYYGAAACATFGYFFCTMFVNMRGV